MKTVAIIQARLGSSRLPRKVLADLAGEPMLARVVDRTRRAAALDEVMVATTTEPADDELVKLCQQRAWPFYRGSQEDVLDRYYQAACQAAAEIVVRITSDCPFIDPGIVGRLLETFSCRGTPLDYLSNTIPPRTFPRGLDAEVMSIEALERAWRESRESASREHVTMYVYRHPEKFHIDSFQNDRDLSGLRWTVDTPEDLEFARTIYNSFGHDRFSWLDVLEVLSVHPEWTEINSHVLQKPV